MSRYQGHCPGCAKDFFRPFEQTRERYKYSEARTGSCPECGKTCVVDEVSDADFVNQYRCPMCFEDDILVIVRLWAELVEKANEEIQTNVIDTEESWNEGSLMKCRHCDYNAMAKRFDSSRVPSEFLVTGETEEL